ncbi:MAG: glycosyltransferase family 87 protein [Phycisphaerales bacterium]
MSTAVLASLLRRRTYAKGVPLTSSASARIRWFERILVALALFIPLAFGVVTVKRSAFLDSRRTDVGVYFRAAWAIRAGIDPYVVRDTNDWSYLYPPPLAILSIPFAEAPVAGDVSIATQSGGLFQSEVPPNNNGMRYLAGVIVWYLLGVAALFVACHWLAQAIRLSSSDPEIRSMPRFCRRWWQDRLFPAVLCCVAIGSTLVRGQVNTFVLLCIAGMVLWATKRRFFGAGMWVAAAMAIKVFPAFLLLYAIVRRDWKMILGAAAGTALLLFVLPAAVVGPRGALELNRRFLEVMILPHSAELAGMSPEAAKVKELRATGDNQSVRVIAESILTAWSRRGDAGTAPEFTKIAQFAAGIHVVLAALMTSISLWTWWRVRHTGWEALFTIGMLTCVSLAISPVCHMHYFVLAMPLAAALWGIWAERSPTGLATPTMILFAAIYFAMNLVPRFNDGGSPWISDLRVFGIAQFANIALWAAGVFTALRCFRPPDLRPSAAAALDEPGSRLSQPSSPLGV